MKFLFKLASGFAKGVQALVDIYSEISDYIPLLTAYKTEFKDSSEIQQLFVMICKDVLEFHLIALNLLTKKS